MRVLVLHPICAHCACRHAADAPCEAHGRIESALAAPLAGRGTAAWSHPLPRAPRLDEIDGAPYAGDVAGPEAELGAGWGRRERGARRW